MDVILKILSILESMMDLEKPNLDAISADELRISEARRRRSIVMLQESGYIYATYNEYWGPGSNAPVMQVLDIGITLPGLEFLYKYSNKRA